MHSNQSFHVLNSPFPISFRSLPPKSTQSDNNSSSHKWSQVTIPDPTNLTQICVSWSTGLDTVTWVFSTIFCCSTLSLSLSVPDRRERSPYRSLPLPYRSLTDNHYLPISLALLCIFTDNLLCILIHYRLLTDPLQQNVQVHTTKSTTRTSHLLLHHFITIKSNIKKYTREKVGQSTIYVYHYESRWEYYKFFIKRHDVLIMGGVLFCCLMGGGRNNSAQFAMRSQITRTRA